MLAFLYALAIDNPAKPTHPIGPAQTKAVAMAPFPATPIAFSEYYSSLNSFRLVSKSIASGAIKPIPAVTGFAPRTA